MFSADNIVNLNESHYRDRTRPMVFLSHKHDEQSIHPRCSSFPKIGGGWCICRLDGSLYAYTNAINSKWFNWELGLGDAAKYKEHIALLPINRTYENLEEPNI